MFGRFGTGSEADELAPVLIKFDDERGDKFVGVAAGAYHSVALADDGSVWCLGDNNYGQLGHSGGKSLVPCIVKEFCNLVSADSVTDDPEVEKTALLKICSVHAGGGMSAAIDNLCSLWIWGNCEHPSNNDKNSISLTGTFNPINVRGFNGHRVMKVACGNEHVVALVSAGETYKGDDLVCYSWGSNNHGQLGVDKADAILK